MRPRAITSLFRAAFSLVELSIVLVILGLLVGGVMTAQNLIRAAELRSITTDFQRYQTAVMTFKDKYFALPGDMNNATDFWGKAATCPPTSAAPLTSAATCNGDGDGRVEFLPLQERFMFWQHLANTGLIEGSFTGAPDTLTGDGQIGKNLPLSRVPNAGWDSYYLGEIDISEGALIEGTYNNIFFFGTQHPSGSLILGATTPQEAWNIDSKIDDGKAGMGRLVVQEQDASCYVINGSPVMFSTTDPRSNALYNLSDSNNEKFCTFIFRDVYR